MWSSLILLAAVVCAVSATTNCDEVAIGNVTAQLLQCRDCPPITVHARANRALDSVVFSNGVATTFAADRCNSGNGGLFVHSNYRFMAAAEFSDNVDSDDIYTKEENDVCVMKSRFKKCEDASVLLGRCVSVHLQGRPAKAVARRVSAVSCDGVVTREVPTFIADMPAAERAVVDFEVREAVRLVFWGIQTGTGLFASFGNNSAPSIRDKQKGADIFRDVTVKDVTWEFKGAGLAASYSVFNNIQDVVDVYNASLFLREFLQPVYSIANWEFNIDGSIEVTAQYTTLLKVTNSTPFVQGWGTFLGRLVRIGDRLKYTKLAFVRDSSTTFTQP